MALSYLNRRKISKIRHRSTLPIGLHQPRVKPTSDPVTLLSPIVRITVKRVHRMIAHTNSTAVRRRRIHRRSPRDTSPSERARKRRKSIAQPMTAFGSRSNTIMRSMTPRKNCSTPSWTNWRRSASLSKKMPLESTSVWLDEIVRRNHAPSLLQCRWQRI